MKKYIYKISSPSGKIYIGQSSIPVDNKIDSYKHMELYNSSMRKIVLAIKKYSWANMKFEVIESNDMWTKDEINLREIYWINYYDSMTTGYNMTLGGDGVDSECARQLAISHHANMSDDKKKQRSVNCSIGQVARFKKSPESTSTKQRKSDAHKGVYQIESPSGQIWQTSSGLKDFAEQYKDELKISYWQLFFAYRKCYTNTSTKSIRKNINNWKVTRIDKSDN